MSPELARVIDGAPRVRALTVTRVACRLARRDVPAALSEEYFAGEVYRVLRQRYGPAPVNITLTDNGRTVVTVETGGEGTHAERLVRRLADNYGRRTVVL